MHAEITKAVRSPDVTKKFVELFNMEILTTSPEAFAAYQKSEQERWFKVIKENDIKGDLRRCATALEALAVERELDLRGVIVADRLDLDLQGLVVEPPSLGGTRPVQPMTADPVEPLETDRAADVLAIGFVFVRRRVLAEGQGEGAGCRPGWGLESGRPCRRSSRQAAMSLPGVRLDRHLLGLVGQQGGRRRISGSAASDFTAAFRRSSTWERP